MRTFETVKQMAVATGTKAETLARYLARPDAPKRGANGWDREEALEFTKARKAEAAAAMTGDDAELKTRKLLLECGILEEKLEAERRENATAAGKLVAVQDAIESVTAWGAEIATAVRVWRESEMAKHPQIAVDIGRIADRLMESIRDGVTFR